MVLLDSLEEVIGCVVDTCLFDAESFGIGSPEHEHLVEVVLLFEVPDVLANGVEVILFVVAR